jgi:hypothetical protein
MNIIQETTTFSSKSPIILIKISMSLVFKGIFERGRGYLHAADWNHWRNMCFFSDRCTWVNLVRSKFSIKWSNQAPCRPDTCVIDEWELNIITETWKDAYVLNFVLSLVQTNFLRLHYSLSDFSTSSAVISGRNLDTIMALDLSFFDTVTKSSSALQWGAAYELWYSLPQGLQ